MAKTQISQRETLLACAAITQAALKTREVPMEALATAICRLDKAISPERAAAIVVAMVGKGALSVRRSIFLRRTGNVRLHPEAIERIVSGPLPMGAIDPRIVAMRHAPRLRLSDLDKRGRRIAPNG